MKWFRQMLYLLRPLFRLRQSNSEISEEIRVHLELATDANVAAGMSPAEARAAAVRDFGPPELAAERYRDARGVSLISGWTEDLRQSFRSLHHAKLFVAVIVVTLALGIGSAAAIFSLVDWVLFRTFKYPPNVVLVGATNNRGQYNGGRYEVHVQAYRDQAAHVFDEDALARPFPLNVVINGEPVTNGIIAVTQKLLPMVGAVPTLGRGFVPEDNIPGQRTAAIITHRFWKEHFNGEPDTLGKKLVVDQMVCTVVGVLGAEQILPPELKTDVFVPLSLPPAFFSKSVGFWFLMFGHLRSGVTPDQADVELGKINVPLPENIAAYSPFTKPHVKPLAELHAEQQSDMYWILLGAVGFLYGISCLNATNLMVVRMLGRRRELSIRLALGGGHWRLVRLLALESVMISLAASLAGTLIANWLAPLLKLLLEPAAGFQWAQWSLDLRTLWILVGFTALTSVAIVIVPAVRIFRSNAIDGLKDGGVTVGESPKLGRLRRALVIAQVMFAVILLTGAGLMVRTLAKLQHVSLGFDESHLMKAQLAFPPGFAFPPEKGMQRLEELREKLGQVPGVLNVAYGNDPLFRGRFDDGVKVATKDGPPIAVELDFVSEDFLKTTGVRLLRGSMGPKWGPMVLINETFAKAMFGNEDPVGQVMHPVEGGESKNQWHVSGVVSDTRERTRSTPGNHIYASTEWAVGTASTFIVRVGHQPNGEIASLLKRAVYAYNPRFVVSYVAPMSEMRNRQIAVETFVLTTLKVLSALALILTAVGIFSLLAYTVDQRMGEYGVRLVLGATPRDLFELVINRTLLTVAVGAAGGFAGGVGLSRFLRSLLYETAPYEPAVLGSVAIMLTAASVFASLIPAYRAAKADVSHLLRAE